MTEFRESTVRRIRVLQAGDSGARPVVFLHGWPQSARSWSAMMELAAGEFHAVALELPGIGGSTGAATDGSTAELAAAVHAVVEELGLRDVVLVGHDIGGMTTYSYVREFTDLRAAVIMDVVIPGLDPWKTVSANPAIWHFGLHAVPALPELLVRGKEREYFDFFYQALCADAAAITEEARAAYAQAYAGAALTAGFDWYRAFPLDVERNAALSGPVDTPLLYLRGEHERGLMDDYVRGFQQAGVRKLSHDRIPGAGHFAPEEAPGDSWRLISEFIDKEVR